LEREEECILIDTGLSKKASKIITTINSNFPDKPLRAIFLTHHHQDHLGGLEVLKKLYEPSIIAHEEEIPFIMKTKEMPARKGFNGFMLRLFDKLLRLQVVEVDQNVTDKEEIYGLKVLHLPGHTPGTIALVDIETQALFCGDIINADKKGSKILPPSEKYALDYNQALKASLEMFDRTSPSVVLPGHGAPVFDPDEAIKVYLDEYSKV
jgi:glyoxylase-like metal-dependent hydrolase (beta-lactamase superfamily II)